MKLSTKTFGSAPPVLTRRGFLWDACVAAMAISIPVVSVFATAQPIPNPPGRDTKLAMSSAQQALKEQRQDAARARTRQAKKRVDKKRPKRERDSQ